MTRQEFCAEIAEIMEIDDEIVETTDLTGYAEFDSLAIMSIVALVNMKFNRKLPGSELQKIHTVGDLIRMIGEEAFSD